MKKDKRTDKRAPVNLPTKWHGISGAHEGRVEDVSLSGCFVNTTGAVDVGEIVSLVVELPSGRWLSLRGKVVFFHQLTGFSLSFSMLVESEQDALKELVAEQT